MADEETRKLSQPDWEYYRELHHVCLWQASALIHDIEPCEFLSQTTGFFDRDVMPSAVKRTLGIVQNHANASLPLVGKLERDEYDQVSVFCEVELKMFALWSESKKWKLPPQFPRYTNLEIAANWPNAVKEAAASIGIDVAHPPAPRGPVAKTAATLSPSGSAKPADGTVRILLPHTTTDLEAIFKVMREHWSDPAKPPRQKDVAVALDKAIGRWSVTKGKSTSREADLVASLLCPDSHKRARKRDDAK